MRSFKKSLIVYGNPNDDKSKQLMENSKSTDQRLEVVPHEVQSSYQRRADYLAMVWVKIKENTDLVVEWRKEGNKWLEMIDSANEEIRHLHMVFYQLYSEDYPPLLDEFLN